MRVEVRVEVRMEMGVSREQTSTSLPAAARASQKRT